MGSGSVTPSACDRTHRQDPHRARDVTYPLDALPMVLVGFDQKFISAREMYLKWSIYSKIAKSEPLRLLASIHDPVELHRA